jgi:hypothetical protein
MINIIPFAIMIFASITTLAQDFKYVGPLHADLNLPNDDRLIEPTSPIIGKNLTALIKEDKRHPEIVFRHLKSQYPDLIQHLQLSSIAYFDTLIKPLKDYCSTPIKEEANDKDIEVIEIAAIPIIALLPLHKDYRNNLHKIRTNYVESSPLKIKDLAKSRALEYQAARYDCDVVNKLKEMETKIKRILPNHWDGLVDLHSKISSAEAAFPRIQFSVNGFTQYVYDEILKLPFSRLSGLLKIIYGAQIEWIHLKDKGVNGDRFISFFEKKALRNGYLAREILLILAYSTRNMPSLDVQSGYDTEKALLLETYFWKFRDNRNYVTQKFVHDVFPNVVMKKNPGVYHYSTSALLACEVYLNGYSGTMARTVALGNKVGYKIHKLFAELAGNEGKNSLKEIKEIAQRQAFGPGVDAGKYGGKHGLQFCRKNTPPFLSADGLSAELELLK